jgi:hypothetical protein
MMRHVLISCCQTISFVICMPHPYVARTFLGVTGLKLCSHHPLIALGSEYEFYSDIRAAEVQIFQGAAAAEIPTQIAVPGNQIT